MMAKNSGLIQLQGTIGGMTFRRDGTVSKASGSRQITSARTQENNQEFGMAAKQAKVIRDAIRGLDVGDRYLAGRMTQQVRRGVALDPDNERGKRILSNNEAVQVLPGFELNGRSNLTSVAPVAISTEADTLSVSKIGGSVITPMDVYMPGGTDGIQLKILVARLNVDPEVLKVEQVDVTDFDVIEADPANPVNAFSVPIVADPEGLLTIAAVGLKFYQRVNGRNYALQNGSYDVGQIVAAL